MKIGIDCRTILNPAEGEAAGIGHYNYQLVRHLINSDKQNTYVLFFDHAVKEKRITKFKKENVIIRYFPFSQYKKFLPTRYANYLTAAAIEKENLDLFHSPVCELPMAYNGKSIVTIHDLAEFRAENCFEKAEAERLQKVIPESLAKAQGIIAVSNSTKDDVQYLFGIDDTKIKVIYNGIDKRFFNRAELSEVEAVKNKFGIKGKYVLFLGTLETRKNILGIVGAFEALKNSNQEKYRDYQLVLAGRHGHGIKNKLARIKKSAYVKDILVTNYIAADEIGPLYQGAEVFIFPSLYEGFGFPPLEAMAKNIPVLASNHPALVETLGEAAILVDPKKQEVINQGLIKILEDKNLQTELIAKGKIQARKFDWDETTRETLEFYHKIINQK
ncbi:MAG: glycosyltransferase family 1 protein [Patescibacteria group bacterium]